MDRPHDIPGPSRLGLEMGTGEYTHDPAESPMAGGTDVYGGSASGAPGGSENEAANYFVGVGEGETEAEDERRKGKRRQSSEEASNL